MPWAYVRRVLAEHWHCMPWEVDEAPADEVQLALRLMNIEGESQTKAAPRLRAEESESNQANG